MKKLILLIGASFVTGCAGLTPIYDNNEYQLLAELETSVRLTQKNCSNANVVTNQLPSMVRDAEVLYTYTFYIPNNTEVYKIAKILRDDIREFETQYKNNQATPTYCKLKTNVFLDKVRDTLSTVARKRRN